MRHQNSVFHQVLKQIDWAGFDGLVVRGGARGSTGRTGGGVVIGPEAGAW